MDRLVTLSKIIEALGPIKGEKSLQKLVYLNEIYGDRLGYQFSWNNYGPISFNLQKEIQEIQTLGLIDITKDNNIPVYSGSAEEHKMTKFWRECKNRYDIPPNSQKLINFIKELGQKRDNPLFLEVMASLDYIRRQKNDQIETYQQLTKNRCSDKIISEAEHSLEQLQIYQ